MSGNSLHLGLTAMRGCAKVTGVAAVAAKMPKGLHGCCRKMELGSRSRDVVVVA